MAGKWARKLPGKMSEKRGRRRCLAGNVGTRYYMYGISFNPDCLIKYISFFAAKKHFTN